MTDIVDSGLHTIRRIRDNHVVRKSVDEDGNVRHNGPNGCITEGVAVVRDRSPVPHRSRAHSSSLVPLKSITWELGDLRSLKSANRSAILTTSSGPPQSWGFNVDLTVRFRLERYPISNPFRRLSFFHFCLSMPEPQKGNVGFSATGPARMCFLISTSLLYPRLRSPSVIHDQFDEHGPGCAKALQTLAESRSPWWQEGAGMAALFVPPVTLKSLTSLLRACSAPQSDGPCRHHSGVYLTGIYETLSSRGRRARHGRRMREAYQKRAHHSSNF